MDTNIKILVVNDFVVMRKIIKDILAQIGYKSIFEAEDGTLALTILKREKIDLIISDWNMPKMTGLELAPPVKPVVLTFCPSFPPTNF